jgi:hypothetical protein
LLGVEVDGILEIISHFNVSIVSSFNISDLSILGNKCFLGNVYCLKVSNDYCLKVGNVYCLKVGNVYCLKVDNNTIIEKMETLDRAWFFNKEANKQKPFSKEPFGNIECICLEIKYKVYI